MILVAGCGYVGSRLAERLVSAGHRVLGLRRSVEGLPAGVVGLAADLTDPTALDALPEEIDLVAYTAAASAPTDGAYEQAYVRGPENLLSALTRRGARVGRVVFTSSTSVYGQQDGSWVDEASPTEPTDSTGQRLLEGERVFSAGPFPACVIRLGGIYGPGRTRLIDDVAAGGARRPAAPRWTNRIHRDDCAGAIAHLLLNEAGAPPVTIGVDHEPADLADVLDWIARRLGVAPPRPASAADGAPSRPERGGKRCSNARLVAAGYRFAFPTYREGYEALIRARSGESPPGPLT